MKIAEKQSIKAPKIPLVEELNSPSAFNTESEVEIANSPKRQRCA